MSRIYYDAETGAITHSLTTDDPGILSRQSGPWVEGEVDDLTAWRVEDGELVPVTEATSDLRAAAIASVVALIEAREVELTGLVPANERASWSAKEVAARAVLAGTATASQLVLIEGEAAVSGESNSTVATRIVARADAWLPVTAAHTGLRRTAFAAITGATTAAQVADAIDDLRTSLWP